MKYKDVFFDDVADNLVHQVKQSMFKRGPGICHAEVGRVAGTIVSKGLCGVLGESTSFYDSNTRLLTPAYTTFHYEVSCEACKDHKSWEIWVLDCTSV